MLPRCIDLKRQFYLQHKELYAFADECIEMSDIILQAIIDLKLKDNELTKYQFIIGFNLYKVLDSYVSVMSLCNDGLVGDAKSIVRKLIEMSVTLKYLSLDKDIRLDQYLCFQALSNYKMFSEMKKEENLEEENKIYSDGLRKQIEQIEPKIMKDYEEAKEYFELNNKGDVKGEYIYKGWSGKTLKEMAIKCNMKEHVIPYKMFCISTHTSIDDIKSFYRADSAEFGSGFSIGDIPIIIIHSSKLYLSVIELCIKAFDLKLNGSFELLRNRLEKFKDHPMFSRQPDLT